MYLRSRLLVYSAGNRVQVVLSGFNMRLFCFVQAKSLCIYMYIFMYICLYFLAALVLVCVNVMVMSSA